MNVRRFPFIQWSVVLSLLKFCGSVRARGDAPRPAPADPAADVGWPRLYKAKGYEVVMHQPQVDRWEEYKTLHIRAAVVIRKEGLPTR